MRKRMKNFFSYSDKPKKLHSFTSSRRSFLGGCPMRAKILSGVFVMAAAALSAQAPHGALLVLSKAEQMLSIVDSGTLTIVAKMPTGPDPHEVTVSSDGRTAYVSNYVNGRYNTI